MSLVFRNKMRKTVALPECDQFTATEFFRDSAGMELADYVVYARASGNPELRAKIEEYLTKVGDSAEFDSSVSDSDVFASIDKARNDFQTQLSAIYTRIKELSAPKSE